MSAVPANLHGLEEPQDRKTGPALRGSVSKHAAL
jgi:hypothetical protein